MRRHRHALLWIPSAAGCLTLSLVATPISARSATTSPITVGGKGTAAAAVARGLPLGRPDVPEVRRTSTLSSGVTWTTVRRGTRPAGTAAIPTTAQGPWTVNIVSISPRSARGRVIVSAGADLRGAERTSAMARSAKALVAVNGGFFAYTASKQAPGDPIGLGVLRGTLTSEPLRGAAAVGLVVDAATLRLSISSFRWAASIRTAQRAKAGVVAQQRLPMDRDAIAVTAVNRLPGLAWNCLPVTQSESGQPAPSANPQPLGVPGLPTCATAGELIRFTGHWGTHTPAGPGTEVIVDRAGCVLRTRSPRGGPLSPAHVSYQATGTLSDRLLALAGRGCLNHSEQLRDADGRLVQLRSTQGAVNGRQVLVRGGVINETRSGPGFAGRHPRTIAGRTARGVIALITIDGRRTTSVGATLGEAARVAKSVGLVDAINLDGGGSTTMVIRGRVVNQVAGRTERAVGDALMYLPR